MQRLIICGVNGKVGQILAETAGSTEEFEVAAGVDKFPDVCKNDFPVYEKIGDCDRKADIVIDFSRPEALPSVLEYAEHNKLPAVIATTGYSDDEKKRIAQAAKKVPVFFSANMSLGVNLQMKLAKIAAGFLGEAFDVEIIEMHHSQKVDAPSGTALAIAEHIGGAYEPEKELVFGRHSRTESRGREIGIHAVRGGTITGDHSVLFIGEDEVVEICHRAQSKQIFANGALRAAAFLAGKPPGLYDMDDLIDAQTKE